MKKEGIWRRGKKNAYLTEYLFEWTNQQTNERMTWMKNEKLKISKVRLNPRAWWHECFILLPVSSRKGNFLHTEKKTNKQTKRPFTNEVIIYKELQIFSSWGNHQFSEFEWTPALPGKTDSRVPITLKTAFLSVLFQKCPGENVPDPTR